MTSTEQVSGRNTELLERTMQYILDHPERHDQVNYCGTSQCFAGWAAHLEGWKIVSTFPAVVEKNGVRRQVGGLAKELLGLTNVEANTLFGGDNARYELQLMVKDLVNGESMRDKFEYWEEGARYRG